MKKSFETEDEIQKKVLVFGVFDGFHKGHQYFLEQAEKLGTQLIISVAQDSVIFDIKQRLPKFKLSSRISTLKKFNKNWIVIAGDRQINTWEVLHKYQPNIIVLGHDQNKLFQALSETKSRFPFLKEIVVLKDFERHKYSSTLLHHAT